MVGGFVLFLLSLSIAEGTYGNAINLFTKVYTGHVQINSTGYLDKPSLYNTFNDFDWIKKKLDAHGEIESYSPRVYSGALAFVGEKTTVARIIGVDPHLESKSTKILGRIKKGSFISDEPVNEVIISGTLSEILKADIGDEFVLIAHGADGSIANDIFIIKGILKGDPGSFDRTSCYMHLKKAQDFLFLHERYHEIKIILSDYKQSQKISKTLTKEISDPKVEVLPWQKVNKQFYEAMQADKRGNWIGLSIIMLICAIGVLNTVLMTVLERTREFGVLKALGTRPLQVFSLIIIETGIMAVFSIVFAVIVGSLFNHLLVAYGWDYPVAVDVGGFVLKTMYGCWEPMIFYFPALITFFSAIIVSIFPAIRAMRIIPVKAMGMH